MQKIVSKTDDSHYFEAFMMGFIAALALVLVILNFVS